VTFFVTAYNKKLNYCKQIARPMNRRLNSCMACHLESRWWPWVAIRGHVNHSKAIMISRKWCFS